MPPKKRNHKKTTKTKTRYFDFYLKIPGEGTTLTEAYYDMIQSADAPGKVRVPVTSLSEHLPEPIFEALNHIGICAVENIPEE